MKWEPDPTAVAQAGLGGKFNGEIATATGPKIPSVKQDHSKLDGTKPDPQNKGK